MHATRGMPRPPMSPSGSALQVCCAVVQRNFISLLLYPHAPLPHYPTAPIRMLPNGSMAPAQSQTSEASSCDVLTGTCRGRTSSTLQRSPSHSAAISKATRCMRASTSSRRCACSSPRRASPAGDAGLTPARGRGSRNGSVQGCRAREGGARGSADEPPAGAGCQFLFQRTFPSHDWS